MRRLVIPALCFACGWCTARREAVAPPMIAPVCDTVIVTDTVRVLRPVPMRSVPLEAAEAVLPKVGSPTDSVTVEVPLAAVEYEGEGYRAYVSGWRPRLDSLILEIPATTVTLREVSPRPSRFSVGIQGGVGITPAGVQPYIGVGVAVRLF